MGSPALSWWAVMVPFPSGSFRNLCMGSVLSLPLTLDHGITHLYVVTGSQGPYLPNSKDSNESKASEKASKVIPTGTLKIPPISHMCSSVFALLWAMHMSLPWGSNYTVSCQGPPSIRRFLVFLVAFTSFCHSLQTVVHTPTSPEGHRVDATTVLAYPEVPEK